jgi:hypothetical protein
MVFMSFNWTQSTPARDKLQITVFTCRVVKVLLEPRRLSRPWSHLGSHGETLMETWRIFFKPFRLTLETVSLPHHGAREDQSKTIEVLL